MDELQQTLIFLGRTVKEQRILRNMTQEQLAVAADVSQSHISDIENLHTDTISLKTIHSLAETLNLPLSGILSPSEAMLCREVEWLRQVLEINLGVKLKNRSKL